VAQTIRVGVQSIPDDQFFVLAYTAIQQRARELGIELVPVDIDNVEVEPLDYTVIVEGLLSQELDALILLEIPKPLFLCIQAEEIPIIFLAEQHACREHNCPNNHTGMVAPFGLYRITQTLADFVAKQIHNSGTIVVIGGMGQTEMGEDGRPKLASIFDKFAGNQAVQLHHIPTSWRYDHAYPKILKELKQQKIIPDVIFGLSDTLALAGRQAVQQLGLLKENTVVVGYNGDPQALAAITLGNMTATIETSAFDFGIQAVELALRAANGQALPAHFSFKPRLITSENVAEASAQKLVAMAELPNQLVGVDRLREHQRLSQLEKSLNINEQIGTILEPAELTRHIVNLIRDSFNYDRVELFLLSEPDRLLILDASTAVQSAVQFDLNEGAAGVLGQVLNKNELIFVPDMLNSQRYRPESRLPTLRTRVALPVRFGGKTFGVLDLQRDSVMQHSREQLLGLQLLADQVAITIRNADSYSEAVAARKLAEKADKLKTMLLANVSHEFRTPLNIIMGYTRGILDDSGAHNYNLPAGLVTELNHIHTSADHLLHLINDLLDLSQAEIDELEIYPAIIDPRPLLEEVFLSLADLNNELPQSSKEWQFEVPPRLPLIQADPVRLRQILINLLSNANKFTREGAITLGTDVQAPYLHIWVADTGIGIPADQQDLIFEPFMVGQPSSQYAREGIGLGLSITSHLVTLHRGSIKFESKPGLGTTFHVQLPLPNLKGKLVSSATGNKQTLVYISNRSEFPAEMEQLRQQDNLNLYQLRPAEVRTRLLDLKPTILAWDSTNLSETDWLAMNFLRTTRQLAELPLMLYGNISREGTLTSLNNILLKPFSGQTLATMLEALGPTQLRGDVLIIDDDIKSLDFYVQLVELAIPGAVVHRAENGRKAINILKELTPSLVIVDLMMPEVDGYQVIEWLRQNPSTRNVPVLVVTGNLLSTKNIERLDYPRVLFHSKDILETGETTTILQKFGDGEGFLSQTNSLLVKRAIAYIHENYNQPLSFAEITQELGISKNQLGKIFHEELGIGLWDYLTRYRIKEAKILLESTDLTIAAIASRVGFDDQSYFGKVFRTIIGQTPKQYRSNISRQGRELHISKN